MVRFVSAIAVLFVLACAPPTESDRFDAALQSQLSPPPTNGEIIRACDALQDVGWDATRLFEARGVTKSGQDRDSDIVAVVTNAQFKYMYNGSRKSDLSWERYHNNEHWLLYCSEKRKS